MTREEEITALAYDCGALIKNNKLDPSIKLIVFTIDELIEFASCINDKTNNEKHI